MSDRPCSTAMSRRSLPRRQERQMQPDFRKMKPLPPSGSFRPPCSLEKPKLRVLARDRDRQIARLDRSDCGPPAATDLECGAVISSAQHIVPRRVTLVSYLR